MSTLFETLEAMWEGAGGSPQSAPMAAGIALAESGGNPDAANTSDPSGGSYGLWQINGVHAPGGEASPSWIANIESPGANASEAVQLSGDGNDWEPWTDDALWDQWVAHGSPPDPTAATVQSWLGAAGSNTGTSTASATLASATQPFPGGAWDPLNAPTEVIGGIVSSGVSSVASGVEHFVAKALLVLAGLAIAGYGLIKLVDPDKAISSVVQEAAPVVAAA